MKFWLPIILLSAALAAQAADSLPWQSVSVNDGQVTLQMPGEPEKTTRSASSIVGTVNSTIYTVIVPADGSVSIDCSDLPGTALFFAGADTIYSNAKGKFLSQAYGKELSWESVTTDGQDGMKLMFQTAPMNGKPGYDGEAQFFLVGDYLYVISVTDLVGHDLEMQKKVFPSVKFAGSGN